jgi:inner membrane protease subunit 1
MLPTLNARGDVVLLSPRPVRRGDVQIGDIVVARSPVNPRHTVCKRVAGLPGGRVDPWAGGGQGAAAPAPTIPIPPGHVWLQGDNAANSTDSRVYGPVPLALLRGRVRWRVWPPAQAGRVDGGPGGAWAVQVYKGQHRGQQGGDRPRY